MYGSGFDKCGDAFLLAFWVHFVVTMGKDGQRLPETYRAAFIAKPYQLAKLQQKVREVLDSVS